MKKSGRRTKKTISRARAKPDSFFKVYFILIIILAIMSIVDVLFLSGTIQFSSLGYHKGIIVWMIILGFFYLAMFILSIVALVNFTKKKHSWFVFTVPIILLADFIISIVITLVNFNSFFNNQSYYAPWVIVSTVVVMAVILVLS
ncbi:MAG: hypothetical protein JSW08_02705, partial [archaeon]